MGHLSSSVLLLADDTTWAQAVERCAKGCGRQVQTTVSANEAVRRLVSPSHGFSHLFVQSCLTNAELDDLVSLTVGEAGSGVQLVMLGSRGDAPPQAGLVEKPDQMPGCQNFDLMGYGSPPLGAWPGDLTHSLEAEYIETRFQPVVHVQGRVPLGVEVLARLRHGQGGFLAPGAFVPQMERTGLVRRLTELVLTSALTALPATFLKQHAMRLTFNLPLDLLLCKDMCDYLLQLAADHGLPAELIMVELTERAVVTDVDELARAVDRWRTAGFELAIDDLGPGLRRGRALFALPFSSVKLDRLLVSHSATEPRIASYLSRVIDLAKRESLLVIAEGIENRADWDRLAALGVDAMQGYWVGRAMPARVLPIWMQDWNARH